LDVVLARENKSWWSTYFPDHYGYGWSVQYIGSVVRDTRL